MHPKSQAPFPVGKDPETGQLFYRFNGTARSEADQREIFTSRGWLPERFGDLRRQTPITGGPDNLPICTPIFPNTNISAETKTREGRAISAMADWQAAQVSSFAMSIVNPPESTGNPSERATPFVLTQDLREESIRRVAAKANLDTVRGQSSSGILSHIPGAHYVTEWKQWLHDHMSRRHSAPKAPEI